MSDENDNGRAPGGRAPLTLKPRGAGSVSAGTVKQSFSHGRSKTVVVETKRQRTHAAPTGNLAAPSSAEKRAYSPQPSSPRPSQGGSSNDGSGLSADEQRARIIARDDVEADNAAPEGFGGGETADVQSRCQVVLLGQIPEHSIVRSACLNPRTAQSLHRPYLRVSLR